MVIVIRMAMENEKDDDENSDDDKTYFEVQALKLPGNGYDVMMTKNGNHCKNGDMMSMTSDESNGYDDKNGNHCKNGDDDKEMTTASARMMLDDEKGKDDINKK